MKSIYPILFLIPFSLMSEEVSSPLRSFQSEVEKFNLHKEEVADPTAPAPKNGEKAKTREILVVEDLEGSLREEFDALSTPEIEILNKLDLLELRVVEFYELQKAALPSFQKQIQMQLSQNPSKDEKELNELRDLADEKPVGPSAQAKTHGELSSDQKKILQDMLNQALSDFSNGKLEESTEQQLKVVATIKNNLSSKLSELKIRDIGIAPHRAEISQKVNGVLVIKIPFVARLYYEKAGVFRPSGTSYIYGQIKFHSGLEVGCIADVQKCVPSNDADKTSHAFFEVQARDLILGEDNEFNENLNNIEIAISSLIQFELASEIVSKVKGFSPQLASMMMQLLLSKDEAALKMKKANMEAALKAFKSQREAASKAKKVNPNVEIPSAK